MLRKSPIPISFAIVVSVVIALFVFFGAWAVSVDAADHDRELSFAIGNTTPTFGAGSLTQNIDRAGTSATADGGSSADTWWGRSLLAVCPLH